jgi:hypothetical protein
MRRIVWKTRIASSLVWLRTGHIYSFTYDRYQMDPRPTVILLYAVQGTDERTGHQHNYFQAVNFHYIPMSQRRQFARIWTVMLEKYGANVIFTWEMISRVYPYLKIAFRRYSLERGAVRDLKEIPLEDINQAVIQGADYVKQIARTGLLRANKKVVAPQRQAKRLGAPI